MPPLTWNSKYSVGVAAMDAQHQTFFGILNRLHEAMLQGKGRDQQQEILSEVVAYTRAHFLQEELFLKLNGYPNLREHRDQHAAFVRRLTDLESKVRSGAPVLTIDVMAFLQMWLSEHILREDAQYGTFLQAQ